MLHHGSAARFTFIFIKAKNGLKFSSPDAKADMDGHSTGRSIVIPNRMATGVPARGPHARRQYGDAREIDGITPKPGEIFDGTRLDDFFKVNRAILPSDASKDDVNIKRDLKTRTVAILFDFRACPSDAN